MFGFFCCNTYSLLQQIMNVSTRVYISVQIKPDCVLKLLLICLCAATLFPENSDRSPFGGRGFHIRVNVQQLWNESTHIAKFHWEKARQNLNMLFVLSRKGEPILLYIQSVGPNHRSHSHLAKWYKNVTPAALFYAIRNGN